MSLTRTLLTRVLVLGTRRQCHQVQRRRVGVTLAVGAFARAPRAPFRVRPRLPNPMMALPRHSTPIGTFRTTGRHEYTIKAHFLCKRTVCCAGAVVSLNIIQTFFRS